ncbi:glycosyltransferase [filamentous cyanobacterium LEGE 11480]|uniref:Glycosyltransferase n=1 Tax=Romeriopsis navalis LEGE 11480 TaxID=2777977 RepID=A0A928Z1L8_9CYAN|nr:glycosyltransferase family 2 protein [Romeriopsis navalis]MBE9028142.1 glycosyltransferase [Romeriopsis navalis LEGE 11480]
MILADGVWLSVSLSLVASLIANSIWWKNLSTSLEKAPQLQTIEQIPASLPSISVIIPAYNEAANIQGCVQAVLDNQLPDNATLQIIVADDESTDETHELAQAIAQKHAQVQVIRVPPRPQTETWRGKNWACAQAVQQATGEYWLFIDADVRLEPRAIATALTEAQQQQSDLLSLAPEIVCGCLAEWLVQPLIMSMIAIGFEFDGVNNPDDRETAFAAGPFMLFRQSAYQKIGGHEAIAADPVEDVALAKAIKQTGLKLRYILALGIIKVRMYQNLAALWEGWTKNFYLGANRNVGTIFYSSFAVFLVFVMPWIGLSTTLIGGLMHRSSPIIGLFGLMAGLSVVALIQQYRMRASSARQFNQPLRYWSLTWLGGIILMAIAIASMIKTETGWGWTWRGRPLAAPEQS